MPLETNGFDGLMTDIAGMASRMDADGAGAGTAKRILEAAAVPIHEQRKANPTKDPQRRSGTMRTIMSRLSSMGMEAPPQRPRIPTSVPPTTPAQMSHMRSSAKVYGTR